MLSGRKLAWSIAKETMPAAIQRKAPLQIVKAAVYMYMVSIISY